MKLHAFLFALLLLSVTSPALAAEPAPVQDIPSHSVRITGVVKAPAEFDVAALKQLVPSDTGPIKLVCASGATVGKVDNFRGVHLTDLLDRVGIVLKDHRDDRRMVIVARATDGYLVTFSWSELYNTAIGKEVLVAWEKDGKPLDAHEGELLLVSGQDIKTGPRRVRQLDRIEVILMK